MSGKKFLIDTNVVIGLEDSRPVEAAFATLSRKCSEHAVRLFVDGASYDDIGRDEDIPRRTVTLSKLDKFEKLRGIPIPAVDELEAKYGKIKSVNDSADVRLLVALTARAVDFVVTQDNGLHKRAEKCGLADRVLSVAKGIEWLEHIYEPKSVELPYVVQRKAYELDTADPIFESLREGYPGFDAWFAKCASEHRDCWVVEIGKELAGIAIRKEENHAQAGTYHKGPRILKICTFKMKPEFRGEKFGEQLLKQILWYAQQNAYDLVYVTSFPSQSVLIDLLKFFGFEITQTLLNGELVLEKTLGRGPIDLATFPNPLALHRYHYPRFFDGASIGKFYVPIQPDYHRRLFPEIAFLAELPLFGTEIESAPAGKRGESRIPGNTIRKVYLCRAKTKSLVPGSILLFYMSKDTRYQLSQAVTTIGIVEQINHARTIEDLVALTERRSVFLQSELEGILRLNDTPVLVIDFFLAGHLQRPIYLGDLVRFGAATSHPQSIAELSPAQYTALRPSLNLGFEL